MVQPLSSWGLCRLLPPLPHGLRRFSGLSWAVLPCPNFLGQDLGGRRESMETLVAADSLLARWEPIGHELDSPALKHYFGQYIPVCLFYLLYSVIP